MSDILTDISLKEDITSVTLYNVPFGIKNIALIFSELSIACVNIDMISQTPPKGKYVDVSFTVDDLALSDIMSVVSILKRELPDISSGISSGNAKLTFHGEHINDSPGIASYIFSLFEKNKVDVNIITTSDKDISVLIPGHSIQKISDAITEVFHMTIL